MTLEHDGKRITMISLIIPLLMQNIFSQLYGTANTVLLSGYLTSAVSAASVANQVFSISVVMLNMISTGTVILSSIELGAKNRDRAAGYAGTGAFTVIGAAIVLGAINFLAAEPILSLVNLRGETLDLACKYMRVNACFLPALGLMNFFSQLLICNGYSKLTLIVGVSSNAINLLLSYVAIYSGLSLTTPIEQVAIAEGIAKILGLLLAIYFFKRKGCPFALHYTPRSMIKIFKLGVPGAMVKQQ